MNTRRFLHNQLRVNQTANKYAHDWSRPKSKYLREVRSHAYTRVLNKTENRKITTSNIGKSLLLRYSVDFHRRKKVLRRIRARFA